MEKFGIRTLRQTKPILSDLGTYLTKVVPNDPLQDGSMFLISISLYMPISGQAIPDTKLTIKKYADVKFEYLSYCLKVSIVNIMIAFVIIVVTIAFATEDFL